jgi:hypothetical protein
MPSALLQLKGKREKAGLQAVSTSPSIYKFFVVLQFRELVLGKSKGIVGEWPDY